MAKSDKLSPFGRHLRNMAPSTYSHSNRYVIAHGEPIKVAKAELLVRRYECRVKVQANFDR